MITILLAAFLCLLSPAHADDSWRELRVFVNCERQVRVEACTRISAYLVDHGVLRPAPRAEADVVVHISASPVATRDEILLRFTSDREGAPASLETVQSVDALAGTDAQWAELEPALLRGIAPYVLQVAPQALSVAIHAPVDAPDAPEHTSPWDFAIDVGGWGNWSGQFSYVQTDAMTRLQRTTERSRLVLAPGVSREATRQPPLVIQGEEISLDSEAWSLRLHALAVRNLGPRWAVGAVLRGGAQDAEAQFERTMRAHAGVEHNWFDADDARGNSLSLSYLLGIQADRYHATNVLGERKARFPSHMLLLGGDIRKDRYRLGIDASARAELLAPARRYVAEAGAWGSLVMGPHLDLSFGGGVTRQAIPGPAELDGGDFQAVTQADYAQPLSAWSRAWITVHWDRSNAVRNDRFRTPASLRALANL